jgi:hypothetical protein
MVDDRDLVTGEFGHVLVALAAIDDHDGIPGGHLHLCGMRDLDAQVADHPTQRIALQVARIHDARGDSPACKDTLHAECGCNRVVIRKIMRLHVDRPTPADDAQEILQSAHRRHYRMHPRRRQGGGGGRAVSPSPI